MKGDIMKEVCAFLVVLFFVTFTFGQTAESAKEKGNCQIEVRVELGYSPASHNLYIGSPGYFNRSVVQKRLSADVCANKKFQYGGSIIDQRALGVNFKTAYDKVEYGGYVSYKLPKGFGVSGAVNRNSYGGWQYISAKMEISKEFKIRKNFTVTVKNATYRIWNSKKLSYVGNWVNKSGAEFRMDFKKRATLKFTPAISFDDNPFNVGIHNHIVGMGWASGRADIAVAKGFGVYASFDWYTKLRPGGYTDRIGAHTAIGAGISYTWRRK